MSQLSDPLNLQQRLLETYDSALDHSGINGGRLASRLAALSSIGLTKEEGSYRIGFSQEERQAKDLVIGWMEEAGLSVTEDQAGNVFGRLEGEENSESVVLSGSHVDTVPNGGHFDGTLGVLSALEVVEAWHQTGYRPNKSYEVVIFSDEEGTRFNGGLIGSEAMVGDLDVTGLKQKKDLNGISSDEVMNRIGLSIDDFRKAKRDLNKISAYVEVHIEQGKQLEKANVATGIVTGIAGPCWLEVTFTGESGHAGSTPMDNRNDALVAAGEFITEVNQLPKQVSSTAVATIGKLNVHPNGVNVIPGQVTLYVDIRDIYLETRDKLVDLVIQKAEAISEKHGGSVSYKETLRVSPVPIEADMQNKLEKSVKAQNIKPVYLPSGAAHDAMNVGQHLPVAMLFVRSKDGISHNPKEWSALNDCVKTVHVLNDFLKKLLV
ncbi:allantoate deiminase [Scopulibacillus darangshiensis]|uniref:Allantoate deiminase n=1 Tax=Scopulibacillus darangshiensis TaxID=442528 RepID=A0A4R2P4B6_9BACL|nr:M20 family metallo-hydrolase [Scopulibacillus darangshiensis]TCP29582.1 allantoate deiminase [Scopulibacillus darangshiensis]